MSEVDRLADEYIDLYFTANPLFASALGIRGEHDARLADHSADAEWRQRAALADLAVRAEAIPPDTLSAQDALTRQVVIQQARAAVDLIDARLPDVVVSDGLSAPALLPMTAFAMITLPTEDAARGHLKRLGAMSSYLDTITERQRAGAAEGNLPPGFLVEAGIAYVDRYLAGTGTDPLRIRPQVEVAGYAEEQERLLAEVVRPAYRRYREFLAGELAPRGLPADRPGLCWLPDGERRYAGLVRAHTTTERTAQDLHDTGLRLIERLADEYAELGKRVFGTGDLGEIFRRLRTDPELRWRDGEELLEAARAAIARTEAVAPLWFRSVPSQRCEVRAVPETEADGGTIAYYIEPAMDGSRPGVYYANTDRAHERSRHVSEAIAFHEAVPGHHFQLSTSIGLTELPLLRRIADVNAYIEGWGLYAERLADEMGLYSGDVARLGMLAQDSMRAGRLVVDTGMHALGWSRQQAVDYLLENVPLGRVEIEAEVNRYVAVPGQALSYMVGRLEIQRIRAEAEAALGPEFDIRDFHDVVLGNGHLPLSVLASVVTDWVGGRTAS
ncbi:DUF885 domain-containing protein [Amycolatopsis aidingensis]|uniref:DUF885 domain-containing protein n=1 Tax=Amycolatopsis aidingensis TaxID=2842453 RepID=UPI001C0AA37D|nr:DUF885 domain-containing protein [Amycolatopsis aidingensis]